MKRGLLMAFGLGVLLVACRSKESAQSQQQPAPVTPPANSLLPIVPKAIEPARPPEPPPVPTEEDFEEDAAREITSKNLEEELDKLEQELKKP